MNTIATSKRFTFERLTTLPDPKDTTEWLVEGIIVKSGINYLTANAGHGKSLLPLDLAHSLSHNRKFLDIFPVEHLHVGYIDQDNNNRRELNKRILAFGFEENCSFYRMDQQNLRLDIEEDVLELAEECLSKDIQVVIIDALVRFHRLSETNPADMATIRQNLQHLTSIGITVLVIHHNSRRGTFRGGMEIVAMADAMVNLKKTSKTSRRFILSIEKERTEWTKDWNHIEITPAEQDGRTMLVGRTFWSEEDDTDEIEAVILDFCEDDCRTKIDIRNEVRGDTTKIDAAIASLLASGSLTMFQEGRKKLYRTSGSIDGGDGVDDQYFAAIINLHSSRWNSIRERSRYF